MWFVSFSQQRTIIYSYKALITWYFFLEIIILLKIYLPEFQT